MDATAILEAETHLKKVDPLFAGLISEYELVYHPRSEDTFSSLSRSIIGQQVSVAAANAISKRFEAMTDMLPQRVVALTESDIKEIGLSRQKAGYLHDLAEHFVAQPNIYDHLSKMSDEKVIEELIKVKGIGVWTAQMFLLFTLGRQDIFAPDDIGLQRGMEKLYGWEIGKKRAEFATHAESWKPYRSVASLYLWRSLDNTPN